MPCKDFDISGSNTSDFVGKFVQFQMDSSLTSEDRKHDKIIQKNFKNALIAVIKKLKSGNLVTRYDVENWNRIISNDIYPHERTIKTPESQIRGTVREESEDRRSRTLSLSRSFIGLDDSLLFLPPEEVPGRLQEILNKLNALNRSSGLRDVAELYREFIFVHPFLEGNGRTARLLTEYALMKIGYSVNSRSKGLPRKVLFKTLEELEQEVEQTFLTPAFNTRNYFFGCASAYSIFFGVSNHLRKKSLPQQ